MEKLCLPFKAFFRRLLACAVWVALPGTSICNASDITLAWDSSLDPVSGYILFHGEQSVLIHPATATDVGTAQQYTVTELTPATLYFFAVKAYNAYGQSGYSSEIAYPAPPAANTSTATTISTLSTTAAASSVPATSITSASTAATSSLPSTASTAPGSGAVTLGWNASPDPVTGYTVFFGRQSVLANPAAAASTDAGNVLQRTITGLAAGATYYFALKASSASGQSDFSNEVFCTVSATGETPATTSAAGTTSSTPPPTTTSSGAATSAATTAASTSSSTTTAATVSVTLAWNASPDPVAGYSVFYGRQSVVANPAAAAVINAGSALQRTITGLAAGTTYYFALKAYTASGESGFSNEVSYTPESAAPTSTSTAPAPPPATTSAPPADSSTSSAAVCTTTTTGASTTIRLKKDKKSLPAAGKGAIPPGLRTAAATGAPDAVTVFENSHIATRLSIAWQEYNDLHGGARIAAGDIDGDGYDEIVLGLGPVAANAGVPGGNFQIFDDDFTDLGWGRIAWNDYNAANGESWPACGDIDGDGRDEILIGLGAGGMGLTEIFRFRDGSAVHDSWIQVGWPEYIEAGGGVRPACGNINADRKDEIILGLYPVTESFLPEGRFEVLNGRARHLAWGTVDWPEYNAIHGATRPACGDINLTMREEILVGLGPGSEGWVPVYTYALRNLRLAAWVQAGTGDYRERNGETRIACGDVDNDGFDEILVGFGSDGGGFMELHDDAAHDFEQVASFQLPDEYYNLVNGEAYTAIASMNAPPRLLKFFIKMLPGKTQ